MHLSIAILGIFTIFSCKKTVKTSDLRSAASSVTSVAPGPSKSPPEVALLAHFDWPSQSLKISAHKPAPNASFRDQVESTTKVADRACGPEPVALPFSQNALENLPFKESSYSKLQFRGFGQGAADLLNLKENAAAHLRFGVLQESLDWQWILARSQTEASSFVAPKPPKFEKVSLKFGSETVDIDKSDVSQISDIYQTPADKKFELSWSSTQAAKSFVFIFMKDRKGGKKHCLLKNSEAKFTFTGDSSFPVDSFSLSAFLVSYSYIQEENFLLIGSDHRHIQLR